MEVTQKVETQRGVEPFLKWAGGKRWLASQYDLGRIEFSGRYIEPFLGSGAMFFSLMPKMGILSDINKDLIDTYVAIRDDWKKVYKILSRHSLHHSDEYYYQERATKRRSLYERAARFIYLNRSCWNGLYRVNLKGEFNVPRGTKNSILLESDNFEGVANALANVELVCKDFEFVIDSSSAGDLIFIDPPYTTSHNLNGFIKYNQKLFEWEDQVRLRNACYRAVDRGARVLVTNADHKSIEALYGDRSAIARLARGSVISGKNVGRGKTTELLIEIAPYGI